VREVIRGCAGEIIGRMAESRLGRDVLFGKSIGEMKGG